MSNVNVPVMQGEHAARPLVRLGLQIQINARVTTNGDELGAKLDHAPRTPRKSKVQLRQMSFGGPVLNHDPHPHCSSIFSGLAVQIELLLSKLNELHSSIMPSPSTIEILDAICFCEYIC